MKSVFSLCLVVAILALAGCGWHQPTSPALSQAGTTSGAASETAGTSAVRADPSDDGDEDGDADLTTMPALVGKTLHQAYGVSGVGDLNVRVEFPSVEATWSAGVGGGGQGSVRSAVLPAIVKTLTEVRPAGHRIISQFPPPGAPISENTTITLIAGAHPGSGRAGWGSGHIKAVARGGSEQCLGSCHLASQCSECHQRYR